MAKNSQIHDRIEALENVLNGNLYEKDEVVRLSLLTAIAGESIFFLGAPGCAKSLCARLISKAFKNDDGKPINFFEILLNQFSTPEDVFGNISLKALNGELEGGKEEYRRLTENMLPEADIAFLDEIWKASPAILNTLLDIINERTFKNGSKKEKVPLKALLAASNELPAKDCGLEALYDRFIMRLPIGFIQDEDNFFQMIEDASSELKLSDELKKLQISNSELETWKKEIDEISLSEEAKLVISAIRKELINQNKNLNEDERGEELIIGDRRWKKITRILKTSAFLNDRNEVDLMDCQLIEYCIWNTEKQQKNAREIVEKCIGQNGIDCDSAIEEINEKIEEFEKIIDEQWFMVVEEPAKEKIVTVDGQKCYECIRDGSNETWYVTVDEVRHSSYSIYDDIYDSGYHDIYDSSKNYVRYADFGKNEDHIECYYNFTVKKIPGKTHLKEKEFASITQETKQKIFDKTHYEPIINAIQLEIKKLKEKKEKDAIPFKANLFANQEYNKNLTLKIDGAIHQLEDAEIAVDKQHNRYFKTMVDASLDVGDVILKNGLVYSSEEINKMTKEEKEDVIAVLCITGDKNYAMGVIEEKMTWNSLKDYAFNYGKGLPEGYSKNWIIPDQEKLNEIWKNMGKINNSLQEVGMSPLTSQIYWSFSQNKNGAGFYQLFDANGTKDHTTKDHKYAVRAIRNWKK